MCPVVLMKGAHHKTSTAATDVDLLDRVVLTIEGNGLFFRGGEGVTGTLQSCDSALHT